MATDLPGIAFEKLIADIQSKMDPNAEVFHNQRLIDRLGHERQFDVVFKGQFGGQSLLGVIECKDFNRKVGNPEVDGFATKARDVNANVKVLISRNGFTKPALEKCHDYGIQPLMLVQDGKSRKINIGSWFRAEKICFGLMQVQILPCEKQEMPEFDVADLKYEGRSLWEGIQTYLNENFDEFEIGWSVLTFAFSEARILSVGESLDVKCSELVIQIEKLKELFERFVPWESQGFFNINLGTATFPAGEPVVGAFFPTDLSQWEKREREKDLHESYMATLHYTYKLPKFENSIDLNEL